MMKLIVWLYEMLTDFLEWLYEETGLKKLFAWLGKAIKLPDEPENRTIPPKLVKLVKLANFLLVLLSPVFYLVSLLNDLLQMVTDRCLSSKWLPYVYWIYVAILLILFKTGGSL